MIIDPVALGFNVARMMQDEALVYCPFHDDSKPSASFNVVKGLFYCFGCQHSATAKQLVQELGGDLNLVPATAPAKKSADEWQWVFNSPLAFDNRYLLERNVTNEQVKKWGIREIGIGVAFPFRNYSGDAIGCQIRKYEGDPKYLILGEKPLVFPFQHLQKGCYVTEGIFGMLNAERFGFKAVATIGAGVSKETANLLSNFSPTVMFDNDFAGYFGAGKLLLFSGAKVIVPGCEADSIEWDSELSENTTGSVELLSRLSKDKERYMKRMKQVIQKWGE